MSANKLKVQAFRANDLSEDTGKQFELGKSWCDFFEIADTVGDISFKLEFKPINNAYESLNGRQIDLQLSGLTNRNDRKAYANGTRSGHSAIKEFFLEDLHLSIENNSGDYFAIYKANAFDYYLYYIPKLLHDNFIRFFESVSPTITISRSSDKKSIGGVCSQQIFYGAPGTGKSHEVKKQTGELLDNGEERDLPNVFRTTFHPDTDYASFVGCYKPTMKPTSKEEKTLTGKDEEIVYEFVPQTFTEAYIYAYTHSTEQTYLVIEEINRGNCAQIFGDLFQLLDRKGGVSEYKIKADKDLANYLVDILGEDSEGIKEGKLCLPANLNILATMNTSDQSLFPMDSAFKRRWEWEYVPINYGTDTKSGTFEITIGDKAYPWVGFIKEVNKKIFNLTQSEDKQLGNFFIKHSVDEKEFKSKVMFYLWYEVLRDETENNKYFFYKKTIVDDKEESSKFIFKDLYDEDATQTLQQFMEYLGVAPK